MGVPSQLGYESIIWGIVLKAQYYLATTGIGSVNINGLKPTYWPGLGIIANRRRKRMINGKKEIYFAPENEAFQGDEKEMSMTRWIFYEMLAKMSKE